MYNEIARMMRKKTSTSFRLSLTLFIISFNFLIILSILLYSQNQQLFSDFINNKNIHLIEINSYSPIDGGNVVDSLNFADVSKIKQISQKYQTENDFVFSEYEINFGISDDQNRTFYLRSYDPITFLESINVGEALSSPKLKAEKIKLQVPNITITDGGFTSDTTEPIELMLRPIVTNDFPAYSLQTYTDVIYVNNNEFQNITEKIYGITWAEFIENYNLENNFGTTLIAKIYVYVTDLNNIKPAANLLGSLGYNVNYTLSSFDDLAKSVDTTLLVFLVLGVLFFLATTTTVIISFKNYFLMNKRDIGILKFYGYSNSAVKRIYQRNNNYIFIIIFLSGFLVTFAFHQLFITKNHTSTLFIFLIIEATFIILMNFTVNLMLRKICYSDTLSLIRNSDELTE